MNTRRLSALALLVCVTAITGCSSSTVKDSHVASFCHGFIQKGLGEYPVDGVDRQAMWLSWNEVVPETLFAGNMDKDSYQRGRDTFGEQMAANNVEAMQDVVDDDCDQGYNPLWRWW